MAAPIKPNKKIILGRTAWWLVPSIATQSAPVTTEINSVSGLNITCFLLSDQAGLDGTTDKIELARLLCETTTTESLDATKFTLPTFRMVWDPQAAAGANDKKAWALLSAGFTGFIVRRQNVVSVLDASVTAGQFVDVAPVVGSVGVPMESGTGAADLYVFDVDFGVTGTPSLNVAVV